MKAHRERAVVARAMRAVRSRDTQPEMLLRKELHMLGLRYTVHRRDLPGTPDIVFAGSRVAVFVDGEFWHGRQWLDRGLPFLSAAFPHNS